MPCSGVVNGEHEAHITQFMRMTEALMKRCPEFPVVATWQTLQMQEIMHFGRKMG